MIFMITEEGLTSVKGFKFAGISAGEESDKRNIGLIYSTVEQTYGAAVYTKNDVVAAPVIVSRSHDEITYNKKAILINSGNANAFTGTQGIVDAKKCVHKVAELLNIAPEEVYIGSTGVIGKKLEVDNILDGISNVVGELEEETEKSCDFIEAIMTTDTKIKQGSTNFEIAGKTVHMASCVKGAGMIMPNMATMLCVITTDANIIPDLLSKALKEAVKDTFNCITVDGDTSTNDSIFLVSNGLAYNDIIDKENDDYYIFLANLRELMEHMAKEVVRDGEGVTKFITLKVKNTLTYEQARKIAFSIGNSPLVKTTFYGQQLNWGRLLMAVGKAQTGINCDSIDVYVNNFMVVKDGEPALSSDEFKKAEQSLDNTDIDILIDFKQGNQEITIWTSDYSLEYIKINANYIT